MIPCEKGELILTAVLTEGAVKDYAVYIGVGNPQWIMEHGMKLNYRESLSHFPGLEEEDYRR